jgi:hypothetical protein
MKIILIIFISISNTLLFTVETALLFKSVDDIIHQSIGLVYLSGAAFEFHLIETSDEVTFTLTIVR